MLKYIIFLALIVSSQQSSAQKKAVNVIFDTDMGPDYDDAGAIAILHALADSGKANILATIASTKYEGVGPVLEIFNTYFKKPQIPVGVPKGDASVLRDEQHWSDSLRATYAHTRKKNEDFPDAVQLYRKALAAQPDNSVTIITVGFLTNIAALLKSGPDNHSNLPGRELVKKKVNKLVSMAGKYPSGSEFNIAEEAADGKYALENWPLKVIYSGFEIGAKLRSGIPLITDSSIRNSPVQDVFRISVPMAKEDSAGRKSWDQTAVLVGVLGHEPFYNLVKGKIVVDTSGANTWNRSGKNQFYLVEKLPSEQTEQLINRLMKHQPK